MTAAKLIRGDSSAAQDDIRQAVDILRDGGIVIFPTETVYGIAANAARPDAMARLRELKGRPSDKPFSLHIGRPEQAARYVLAPHPTAARLARRAWPGPLTLVCEVPAPASTPAGRELPAEALKELYFDQTIGLRCPDHPLAVSLLGGSTDPIVASSANRAGDPPPTTFEAAVEPFSGLVDVAIDGGKCRYEGASTVVEIRGGALRVLRAGVLEERTIRRMARSEVLFVCTGNSCRSPMAEHLFRAKLAARLGVAAGDLASAGYAVSSAGTFAPLGGAISSGARAELARRGLDGASHRSQPLTPDLVQRCDRIFAMTPEHLAAVKDWAPLAADKTELLDPAGPIADPVGGGPEEYRRCADQIEQAVERRLTEYLDEDRNW